METQGRTSGEAAIRRVPLAELTTAICPRAGGEDVEHTRLLAAVADALPPILVHRATMAVIDGWHRVRAAHLGGADTIAVRFFDGDAGEALVLAVRANTDHGLPLTLADRKAAARRLVRTYPQWSDRRIGEVAGLAHKTVGAVRRATGEIPQTDRRIGRDGRVRRLARPASRTPSSGRREVDTAVRVDRSRILTTLRHDHALRGSGAGRALLQWLDAGPRATAEFTDLVERVPEHCVGPVIGLAHGNARSWSELADRLSARLDEVAGRDRR